MPFNTNRPERQVKADLAARISEKLLLGKGPKQVAHEEGVHVKTVERVKHLFPLFFGLKRKYSRKP